MPGTTRTTTRHGRERVAVIGSGVAGLTAAYVLQRRFDVALYEADERLGGHAHTHDVVTPDIGLAAVDTGFIVHNQRTYPHLIRRFAELGVSSQPTEMSMSIRCDAAVWSTPARRVWVACSPSPGLRSGRRTCGCSSR
jgi:predicted NAD/FAD-binding protein